MMKRRSFLMMLGLSPLAEVEAERQYRVGTCWLRRHNRWMTTGGIGEGQNYKTAESLPNSITVEWDGKYQETTYFFPEKAKR